MAICAPGSRSRSSDENQCAAKERLFAVFFSTCAKDTQSSCSKKNKNSSLSEMENIYINHFFWSKMCLFESIYVQNSRVVVQLPELSGSSTRRKFKRGGSNESANFGHSGLGTRLTVASSILRLVKYFRRKADLQIFLQHDARRTTRQDI